MTVSSLPYAVFGVTGRTGAAAADALLQAGQRVRVVVRNPALGQPWAERGAEVAVADLTDVASMTRALRNVRGAYVVCPQHYAHEDLFERAASMADTVAQASVAAGVPRLVALSSVGADRDSKIGWIGMNREFEQRVGAAGVPTIFLRAAYFMENWTPLVQQAVRTGTLPTFLAPAQRRLPMVATVDVGRAAAALLQEEWTQTCAVTLSGPEDYSPQDVAAVVSAMIHKPVDVAVLPPADWPLALAGAHFSQAALAGFSEMTAGLNSSHIDFKSDARATHRAGTTALKQVVAAIAQSQTA